MYKLINGTGNRLSLQLSRDLVDNFSYDVFCIFIDFRDELLDVFDNDLYLALDV